MNHTTAPPAQGTTQLGLWARRVLIWVGLVAMAGLALGQWLNAPGAWAASNTCVQGQLVARPDVAGVYSTGSAVSIPVLANDGPVVIPAPVSPLAPSGGYATAATPALPGGDAATIQVAVTSVTQPAHGTVAWTAEGVVLYTPNGLFTGSDQFSYTIQDACGQSATGKVVVVVFAADAAATPGLIGGPVNPGDIQVLPLPMGGTLHIPAGLFQGVTSPGTVQFALLDPDTRADVPRAGLLFTSVAFRLTQFMDTSPIENPTFAEPLLLEVTLDPAFVGGANLPHLFYWDEEIQMWQSDGIVRLAYNPATGAAVFAIYHLTEFALFAGPPAPGLYVPVLQGD